MSKPGQTATAPAPKAVEPPQDDDSVTLDLAANRNAGEVLAPAKPAYFAFNTPNYTTSYGRGLSWTNGSAFHVCVDEAIHPEVVKALRASAAKYALPGRVATVAELTKPVPPNIERAMNEERDNRNADRGDIIPSVRQQIVEEVNLRRRYMKKIGIKNA